MSTDAKLTDEDAINYVTMFSASYIAVHSTPDNKKVAHMIASDHHAVVAHGEKASFIEANDAVERKYCWSEDGLEAACAELSQRLPFAVVPENFEF